MAALSSAYRLAWWSCVLLAFVGPLSLVEKVHLSFCLAPAAHRALIPSARALACRWASLRRGRRSAGTSAWCCDSDRTTPLECRSRRAQLCGR